MRVSAYAVLRGVVLNAQVLQAFNNDMVMIRLMLEPWHHPCGALTNRSQSPQNRLVYLSYWAVLLTSLSKMVCTYQIFMVNYMLNVS